MKREFKTPYDELLACLNYLDETKGIENKKIAEKLKVSDSTISRLKLGASPEKTEKYLQLIKQEFRSDLIPFTNNLPDATIDTVMQEVRKTNKLMEQVLEILNKK